MIVEFGSGDLDRLETDPKYDGGRSAPVVRAYRKRMQEIRAAPDERTFYALRSMRFEKLSGSRKGQYSMRLNDQWRLIVAFRGKASTKTIIVMEIVDYH
jgi:proteic killer suppression protein